MISKRCLSGPFLNNPGMVEVDLNKSSPDVVPPYLKRPARSAPDLRKSLLRNRNPAQVPRNDGPAPSRLPTGPRIPVRASATPGLGLNSPAPSFEELSQQRKSKLPSRHKRTPSQLEREYDLFEEDDNVPEEMVLFNIPLTPRPPTDRLAAVEEASIKSAPASTKGKESAETKIPCISTAQSSKRNSTTTKVCSPVSSRSTDSLRLSNDSAGTSPPSSANASATMSSSSDDNVNVMDAKAHLWRTALTSMCEDARALTYSLEELASTKEEKQELSNNFSSFISSIWAPRTKPVAPLPPLRHHSDLDAQDPMPVSREKQKVLARTRPSWLPPKNPEEERRHMMEWAEMMSRASECDRKREIAQKARQIAFEKEKELERCEWADVIVPSIKRGGTAAIEALKSKGEKRQMWWKGIPFSVRGDAWISAIGNDLQLTKSGYSTALERTKSQWTEKEVENAVELTKEVFPTLNLFGPGRPEHETLMNVLQAYAGYRVDVVFPRALPLTSAQSSSDLSGRNELTTVQFHKIAGMLILNIPEASEVFIALANILNRPTPLTYLLGNTQSAADNKSLVLRHIKSESSASFVGSDIDDLFSSLFSSEDILPVDCLARLFDVYVFEGESVLLQAAVVVMREAKKLCPSHFDSKQIGQPGLFAAAKKVRSLGSDIPKAVIDCSSDRFMTLVRQS